MYMYAHEDDVSSEQVNLPKEGIRLNSSLASRSGLGIVPLGKDVSKTTGGIVITSSLSI